MAHYYEWNDDLMANPDIELSVGNVSISEVAKIMKKDKQFMRIGTKKNGLTIILKNCKTNHLLECIPLLIIIQNHFTIYVLKI